jgi:short subunit dehydrogenase-like uncharacterized protein
MNKDFPKILVYGANGYTGRLITQLAKQQGVPITLAGRNEAELLHLSNELGFPYRIFSLADQDSVQESIKDMDVVLHCAGPFSETAKPMVKACLKKKVHYLDITGEIWVFEDIAKKDAAAKKKGIVLMPGVGFDVVPTDCMAGYLHEQMPDGIKLELAFAGSNSLSKGTATTMLKNIHRGSYERENGQLKNLQLGEKSRIIQFADKERWCVAIPWGDIATSYLQTGIPNITVWGAASPGTIKTLGRVNKIKGILKWKWVKRLIKRYIDRNVLGPDEQSRLNNKTQIWGSISNEKGDTLIATLTTPEPYQLTAMTALESAIRVGEGSVYPGYKTPAQAFGNDFILYFDGVSNFEEQTQKYANKHV